MVGTAETRPGSEKFIRKAREKNEKKSKFSRKNEPSRVSIKTNSVEAQFSLSGNWDPTHSPCRTKITSSSLIYIYICVLGMSCTNPKTFAY